MGPREVILSAVVPAVASEVVLVALHALLKKPDRDGSNAPGDAAGDRPAAASGRAEAGPSDVDVDVIIIIMIKINK